jgi:integrase
MHIHAAGIRPATGSSSFIVEHSTGTRGRPGFQRWSRSYPTLQEALAAKEAFKRGELPPATRTRGGLPALPTLQTSTVHDGILQYAADLESAERDGARVKQLVTAFRHAWPELLDRPILGPVGGVCLITEGDFHELRKRLKKQGKTPESIGTDMKRLRSTLRKYDKTFSVPDDCFPELGAPRVRELSERAESAEQGPWRFIDSPTIGALLEFLKLTLCRLSEANEAMVRDFHVNPDGTGRLDLRSQKNRGGLPVLLTEEAVAVYEAQVARADGLYLFPNPETGKPYTRTSVTRLWREACKQTKLPELRGFTVHDLRHHGAMRMLRHGSNLEEIRRAGRWKSLAMVMRYAQALEQNVMQAMRNITAPITTTPRPGLLVAHKGGRA